MLSDDELLRFSAVEIHLIEDLDPEDVLPFFKRNNILNDYQIKKVKHDSGGSRKSKSESLCNLLRRCLPKLDFLIGALYDGRYTWHVKFLTDYPNFPKDSIFGPFELKSSNDTAAVGGSVQNKYNCEKNNSCPKDMNANCKGKLCPEDGPYCSKQPQISSASKCYALASKGKIPKRPDVYVHRAELFGKLKELVSKLQHHPGWVVLHGMGGSGKSVLAAEVARDPSVLGSMFPQIFWIPFDRPFATPSISLDMGPSCSHDEKAVLLSKLSFLYSHVTAAFPQMNAETFTDVDHVLRVLPDLLWKHYPRVLLVLDDVWSSYHVQKFDELSCRYLMTTRDESIICGIDAYKEMMPLHPSGFTHQETLEALGKWLKCPAGELPDLALNIYEETDGHPFVIALIGSLLKTHRNRWSYYYNEIRKNSLDAIKTQTRIGSYVHTSFSESIASSVSELPEDLRQKYLQLATFPLKSLINAKVLSVYWGMDVFTVEDHMDKFACKNLVDKTFDRTLDCDTYTLHNFLHRFLQTFLDESTIKENHLRLMTNYRNVSKGNWAMLPKDRYIHQHIGYHLRGAGLATFFPDVFFNMKFLYDKSLLIGYQSVLDDYLEYKAYIRAENEEKFDEFDKFLNNHAKRFATPSSSVESSDLLHLALQEPPDSCIYKAAIMYL